MFGKNKVISLAFGRGSESEYKDNLHKLCPYLAGEVGLLFTNKPKTEVLESVLRLAIVCLDVLQTFEFKDSLPLTHVQILLVRVASPLTMF